MSCADFERMPLPLWKYMKCGGLTGDFDANLWLELLCSSM